MADKAVFYDGTNLKSSGSGAGYAEINNLTVPNFNGNTAILDTLQLNTTYVTSGTEDVGTTFWDDDNKTISTVLSGGVIGQHFLETFIEGQNDTGTTITNGTPVMYAEAIGASGNFRIEPALASSTTPSFYTVGIVTQDITNGSVGYITIIGKVRGIQTDGANYGETWSDGDVIYVSNVTAGNLTNVPPEAPDPAIPVALVINAHATNGTLEVRPTFPTSLEMLTDVDGADPTTTGDLLSYNAVSGVWDRNSYNINDYVPYTGATTDVKLNTDNLKLYFGAGDDASIYYNGSNLIIDPQEVGGGSTIFNAGNVGIGTTNPLAKLHVYQSASGVTPNTAADDLVVEGTGSFGMTFAGSNTSNTQIRFSDPQNSLAGLIQYSHSAEYMRWYIGGAQRFIAYSDRYVYSADNYKLKFGAGEDASIYYDGTNFNIKTDEVAPSDLHISCGTDKTLILDEPVYMDENFDPISDRGVSAPDLINLDTTNIKIAAFNGLGTLEEVYGHRELNHNYAEGTDISFHIHWAPTTTATGNVKWFIEYYIRDGMGGAVKATGTLSVVDASSTTAWQIHLASLGTVTGTTFEIGDQVSLRLYRDPTDAEDTYGDDAVVHTFGYHYLVNSLGSREIGTK